MEPDSSRQQSEKQQAQTEIHAIACKYKKQTFYWEGGQTLAEIVKISCRHSVLEGTQNLIGHSPEQSAVADPTSSRGLDWMLSRGDLQPQLVRDSVNS